MRSSPTTTSSMRLRHLAFTRQNKVLRPVDYRNLATEELGGVYEGLLELTPRVSGDGADFTLERFAGNKRKKTESFYTPDSWCSACWIRPWTRWWRRRCETAETRTERWYGDRLQIETTDFLGEYDEPGVDVFQTRASPPVPLGREVDDVAWWR